MSSTVLTRIEDGVATLTLNRPLAMNAFDGDTARAIIEAVEAFGADPAVRVMVVSGEGKSFSAGGDFNWVLTWPGLDAITRRVGADAVMGAVQAVYDFPKPSIARVHGAAVGGGIGLMLACDFAIAARSAQLGSATLRMGWQPDEGGHWLLVEHLGVKRALEFLLRKEIVPAEEAARLGLVNEVVDDEKLMPHALGLAAELAKGPQVAMRLLKRATYNAAALSFDQAGDDIAAKTAISDFHTDAREGAPAFFERRPAVFNKWLAGEDETAEHP